MSTWIVCLFAIIFILLIDCTTSERRPVLELPYGQVHFRQIGATGLRAALGNPYKVPETNMSLPRRRDQVRTVSISWKPDEPVFVTLEVYVTVFNPAKSSYSTSKISLRVDSYELTYSIEKPFLKQFNIDCSTSNSSDKSMKPNVPLSKAMNKDDNIFVHKLQLPSTTKAVIFGLHDWTVFPKDRLFYPPAAITFYGRSFYSFPLASGIASRCRVEPFNNEYSITVEISGEYELVSKVGTPPRVYAHADAVAEVAAYYAQTKIEPRCSSGCLPVYFDDRTVSQISTVIDEKLENRFGEFSCRPDSYDRVLEWWNCPDRGKQNVSDVGRTPAIVPVQSTNVEIVASGVPKFNLSAALGDYLVYCSNDRFRDKRPLRWKWYNETAASFVDFPLKGWRGSDTSCLWFTASLQESISNKAYQCLHASTGRPVKEIFFEYDTNVLKDPSKTKGIFTESCRFHVEEASRGKARSSKQPSEFLVKLGETSRAKVTCQVRENLDTSCQGNFADECKKKFLSTYSVVRWDKTEATSSEPNVILDAKYVKESENLGEFFLHITTYFKTDSSLDNFKGIYTLVLHYENDVSQLVLQFRLGNADDEMSETKETNKSNKNKMNLNQIFYTFAFIHLFYSYFIF